jgi:hypothetical protein
MKMSNSNLERLFGLSLILTLFSLLGVISTLLNLLQVLNGLICFSRVETSVGVKDSSISEFAISGFRNNHVWHIDDFCPRNGSDVYPFCIFENNHLKCKQENQRSGINYYYEMDINCTPSSEDKSNSFGLQISLGSSSLYGASDNHFNFEVSVVSFTEYCGLNSRFYFLFSIFSLIFVFLVLILRAGLRINFFMITSKIHLEANFVYKVLDSFSFFDFCCSKSNTPDFIGRGDEFMMVYFESGSEKDLNNPFDEKSLNGWNFLHRDGSNFYRVWKNDMTVNIMISDCSGVKKISGPPNLKMRLLREYTIGRSKGLHCLKPGLSHNLNLAEIETLINEGFRLKIDIWQGADNEVLGQWEPANPSKANRYKIMSHCFSFFGFYSDEIVRLAMSGRLKKPDISTIKNTEWKIYLSDLYFHLGQKPESKTKKFQMSKTLVNLDLDKKIKIKTDNFTDAVLNLIPLKVSDKPREKNKENDENLESKPILDCDSDRLEAAKQMKKEGITEDQKSIILMGGKWPVKSDVVLNKGAFNTLNWAAKKDPDLLKDRLALLPNPSICQSVDDALGVMNEKDIDELESFLNKMSKNLTLKGSYTIPKPNSESELIRLKESYNKMRNEISFRFYGERLEKKIKVLSKKEGEEEAKLLIKMKGEENALTEAKEKFEKEYSELKESLVKGSPLIKIWELASNPVLIEKVRKANCIKDVKPVKSKPKLKDKFLKELGSASKSKQYKILKDKIIESLDRCDSEGKVPGFNKFEFNVNGLIYKLPKVFKNPYSRARRSKSKSEKKTRRSFKNENHYTCLIFLITVASILARKGVGGISKIDSEFVENFLSSFIKDLFNPFLLAKINSEVHDEFS